MPGLEQPCEIEPLSSHSTPQSTPDWASESSGRLSVLIAMLLALLTALVYASSLKNGFVNYDDPDYVTNNPHILQGLSWHNVAWALTATEQANWHPLTWISHMADVQFFGLHPGGHHLVNLLLHMLNVVLLFLLLKCATRAVYRSAFVAALFAVCPLNVESIAWIAQRKSLLSTMFLLLALFAYGWYVRRPGISRYLAVAGLFALGLMSKPMLVMLPLMLILVDYWPLERISAGPQGLADVDPRKKIMDLVAEKVPLFALSLASAAVTLYAQKAGGAVGSMAILPLRVRLNNAIYSYVDYIAKALWPAKLAVFYPHPKGSLAEWKVLAAASIMVAVSCLAWVHRRRKWLVSGWLWYVLTLVPVIGIVQVGMQAMADRYAYVPFVGLFVVAVWAGTELAPNLRISNAVLAIVALTVIGGYSFTSHRQIGYWRDSYTLFSHAVEVTSRNAIAEDNLGATLVSMGRPDMAVGHIEAAIRWMPELSLAHYNYGVILQTEGRLEEAVSEYRTALRYVSDPAEAAREHNNLGSAYDRLGKPAAAVSEFTAAIALNPGEVNSLLGRGEIELSTGDFGAARNDFNAAVRISPSSLSLFWLGRAMEDQGDLLSAEAEYVAALKVEPNMREARQQLAIIQTRLGNEVSSEQR